VALLFVTLWKLELTAKNASMKLKKLRRRLEAESAEPLPEPVAAP
jgi:hypothetical protein